MLLPVYYMQGIYIMHCVFILCLLRSSISESLSKAEELYTR